MTKQDVISSITKKTKVSKKEAICFLDAFMETVKEALEAGEKITLTGFGSFEVRERAARKGINPKTKEEIMIAASKYPAFKPGKCLKDAV